MKYEAVIGLEVHVQIKTQSKMFSRVAAGYGELENKLTDPTVLALPGALPVINKAALDAIIKAGLMLSCEIPAVCKWDRKNYFYPDSPKNYQITQYDQPICVGGYVEIPAIEGQQELRKITLTRIHLEEDVGKLNHGAVDSLVDYNRAGTPLMELVSEPAIYSADDAYEFLISLRDTLRNGKISDCDMEKGQMRCDANISIRPHGGTKLGTKVELKNLNSISFVRDGIEHEIKRQIAVLESGGTIVQETRDYDGQTGVSQSLRTKEMAHDYRYFPDPDLMPVKVTPEWISELRTQIPECTPIRKKKYLEDTYSLSPSITSTITPSLAVTGYFEKSIAQISHLTQSPTSYKFEIQPTGVAPGVDIQNFVVPLNYQPPSDVNLVQLTGNWIVNSLLPAFATSGRAFDENFIPPTALVEHVMISGSGIIPSNAAKDVFAEMFRSAGATLELPRDIVTKKGLLAPTDAGELEQWCRDSIAANPKALAEFKSGKDSAINAFKGPIMKAAKGKANPKAVDETLRKLLAAL